MCHVTTATKRLKDDSLTLNELKEHSVTKTAIPLFGNINYHLLNSTHIVALESQTNQGGFTQQDIVSHTLNVSPTSRLGGMPESEMQKVHTLLKNGLHFVLHSIMFASIVKNPNLLQKTTSFLYRKVVAITYRTSNHYVALATVGSGRSFNIYENPDLIVNK